MFNYILTAVIAVLIGLFYYHDRKQRETFRTVIDRLSNTAVNVAHLETKIDNIDKATGSDIFRLRQDFELFREEYGEAAIEEMRQAANQQKAWADGINNLMSYGARYQGGGNAK